MTAGARDAYGTLKDRGFIYQCTDEQALGELLRRESVTCYIGFDPTADSLHVGSLVPLMALRHMKRAGHGVILLVGGGTAMVGDPSGKQKMRPMMSEETIRKNARDILSQLSGVVEGGVEEGPPARALDNTSWLLDLGYVQFLREIGRHLSVNRMLARESARRRYDSDEGLSFIEFNYMCLQAFDFLHLYREHECRLQMGGQDQWGNICEGIDLIARPELGGGRAFGVTFPLLLASSGEKFGKTADGAVWLDADRTPPFDYYQFWRSCEDEDVERFLLLFTDLDAETVRARCGENVNRSKEILAYETTRIVHGERVAAEVFQTAVRQFRPADPEHAITMGSSIPRVEGAGGADASVPRTEIPAGEFPLGILDVAVRSGLCKSKGEARRLVRQGGLYLAGVRVEDEKALVEMPGEGGVLVAAGKKRRRRVVAA